MAFEVWCLVSEDQLSFIDFLLSVDLDQSIELFQIMLERTRNTFKGTPHRREDGCTFV